MAKVQLCLLLRSLELKAHTWILSLWHKSCTVLGVWPRGLIFIESGVLGRLPRSELPSFPTSFLGATGATPSKEISSEELLLGLLLLVKVLPNPLLFKLLYSLFSGLFSVYHLLRFSPELRILLFCLCKWLTPELLLEAAMGWCHWHEPWCLEWQWWQMRFWLELLVSSSMGWCMCWE